MEIPFAIPGDLDTRTGGYAYDRALIAHLREAGRTVRHLPLGRSFPDPTPDDLRHAVETLASLPATTPVLVDGLAYAVLPTDALATVEAPLVALVHHPLADETGTPPGRARILAEAEMAALAHAAAVITTSETTADTLAARFGVARDAITVAVPGLDAAWRQASEPASPPQIVSVGSLIPRKGFDVLLAALGRLTDLPWEAHIVGSLTRDAATADALRAQAAPLGSRVTFHGELSDTAIRGLYAQARVFALPSRHEGFGMVFAEAMAAGLPVVACAAGAVPEVVPREAGALVPVDDPEAFANALAPLLTDDAAWSRAASAARAAGAAFPGWPDTARTVAGVLSSIAQRQEAHP